MSSQETPFPEQETSSIPQSQSSWSAYPILFGFIFIAYQVLKIIQKRSQYVKLPQLAEGQWDPLVANYTWTSSISGGESKFRNEYETLKANPNTEQKLLVQCLMKRAMHDVKNIAEIQQQKGTLLSLVKTGSIGEEVWNRFLDRERSLNTECGMVAAEAEVLKPGWSQTIFQQAGQLLQVELQREKERERQQEEAQKKSKMEWERNQAQKETDEMARELIMEEELERKRPSSGGKKQK
jgi:flagellar biosynthesis component FlhA